MRARIYVYYTNIRLFICYHKINSKNDLSNDCLTSFAVCTMQTLCFPVVFLIICLHFFPVHGELPTPSSENLADQNLVPAEVFIVKVCHKRRKVGVVQII